MAGDGIGPEVMNATLQILSAIESPESCTFTLHECAVGGAAYEQYGNHLPKESIDTALECDAILFGSVGGPIEQAHLPKWKECERNSILSLRKAFNFNTNLRPITIYSELAHISPLKQDRIASGVDLVIVRELLGDIYFGEHTRWTDENGVRCASDNATYSENQIREVARDAFELAEKRKGALCLVHKSNVLEISRLWQDVVREYAAKYPNVTLTEMLVDNCAMQLVLNPSRFDVILTSNLFGDILSDLGAALPGSLGITPSASLNTDGYGLFEPSGGSAPDIAGKGIANPLAQILSLALLFEIQLNLPEQATRIRNACRQTLREGIMTRDLNPLSTVSTQEFTDEVIRRL
jgi:3-isopropylmalate dehydrogenase